MRPLSLIFCAALPPALVLGQSGTAQPARTTVCEIARNPETFEGKLVQVRATVESGVDDLPAGVADEGCGAELKFFMPDDPQFARLLKSKAFRKLIKDVKKNAVVEATVIGRFKRSGAGQKADSGLALESVEGVVVRPLPRGPSQKR